MQVQLSRSLHLLGVGTDAGALREQKCDVHLGRQSDGNHFLLCVDVDDLFEVDVGGVGRGLPGRQVWQLDLKHVQVACAFVAVDLDLLAITEVDATVDKRLALLDVLVHVLIGGHFYELHLLICACRELRVFSKMLDSLDFCEEGLLGVTPQLGFSNSDHLLGRGLLRQGGITLRRHTAIPFFGLRIAWCRAVLV